MVTVPVNPWSSIHYVYVLTSLQKDNYYMLYTLLELFICYYSISFVGSSYCRGCDVFFQSTLLSRLTVFCYSSPENYFILISAITIYFWFLIIKLFYRSYLYNFKWIISLRLKVQALFLWNRSRTFYKDLSFRSKEVGEYIYPNDNFIFLSISFDLLFRL